MYRLAVDRVNPDILILKSQSFPQQFDLHIEMCVQNCSVDLIFKELSSVFYGRSKQGCP